MMNPEPLTRENYAAHLAERQAAGDAGPLRATRCRVDGELYYPPREMCAHGHTEMEWVELSGRGALESFTVIHVAPSAMVAAGYGRQNPYCAGLVRLDEGPRVSAQVVGVDVAHPEDIAMGMRVRATWLERGSGTARRTFLAFEPEGGGEREETAGS